MDILNQENAVRTNHSLGIILLFCLLVVWLYMRKQVKSSLLVEAKIEKAIQDGTWEPVSLHPFIDLGTCIKSGACIEACPEKDILGIVHGRATLVNASQCIGHGACFHACPVEAISLVIGTEKRGVELPHVNENFENQCTISPELGRNGFDQKRHRQGESAVESIIRSNFKRDASMYDLIIIGAGPAGSWATLTAKKHGLNFLTLNQDSLGGTVFNFPRYKLVMTAPVNLPSLYGKIHLYDTTKAQMLELWNTAIARNNITEIRENTKVEGIRSENDCFIVQTLTGEKFRTKTYSSPSAEGAAQKTGHSRRRAGKRSLPPARTRKYCR